MTDVWRVQIDPEVLERADRVTQRLGTSTQEMVRIFVKQIADTGRVPLQLEAGEGPVVTPWEHRAKTLESFYDPAKAW